MTEEKIVEDGNGSGLEYEHVRLPSSENRDEINDEQLISDLKRLKNLRSFFIQEAVNIDASALREIRFGRLNLLRFKEHGRAPTESEWNQVEGQTQALFGLLTEPLRRRFIIGEIP